MRRGTRWPLLVVAMMLVMMASPVATAQDASEASTGDAPSTDVVLDGTGADAMPGETAGDTGASTGDTQDPAPGGATDDGLSSDEGTHDPAPAGAPDNIPADDETGAAPGDTTGAPSEVTGTPQQEEATEPGTRSAAETRIAAGEPSSPVEAAAASTLVIQLTTADGGEIPAGTEVCVDSTEGCQAWAGTALTFTPGYNGPYYAVYVPDGSGYSDAYGSVFIPTGQTLTRTVVLQPVSTVQVDVTAAGGAAVPDGTEVCVDFDNGNSSCETWVGTTLEFTGNAGSGSIAVYPPDGSGFAPMFATFFVAAGATMQVPVELQAPGTLVITVVTADGGALPEDIELSVTPSDEGWATYDGPVTFSVSPGVVTYRADVWGWTAYNDAYGAVEVGPGETVGIVVELQPKGPGVLKVYPTLENGQPAPAGTEVCVSMIEPHVGDPVEDLCQTFYGGYLAFELGEGWANVRVSPPEGSQLSSGKDSFYVELGHTTRAVMVLTPTLEAMDGALDITVRAEDGARLGGGAELCLQPGASVLLGTCLVPYNTLYNEDGSVTYLFDLVGGEYSYQAFASGPYIWEQGTVTVVSGETTSLDIVLASNQDAEPVTLVLSIVTFDGAPVPDGTVACWGSLYVNTEEQCALWEGEPLTVAATPGLVIYGAAPPEESGYLFAYNAIPRLVAPGETVEVEVVLFPRDTTTFISKTVSDESPRSGDTVTYTIRAAGIANGFGPLSYGYEARVDFEIFDMLPPNITDVEISCSGSFFESVPGSCYELDGPNLTVFGQAGFGAYDITITVTGTITGEPGEVVSNTACVTTGRMIEVSAADIGAMHHDGPDSLVCDTADLTIAEDAVEPSPSPSPSATPGTPEPTATPGTPAPTGTPAPGTTPSPAAETPASTTTPQAVVALPNTGDGGGAAGTMLLAAGLGIAALLATAGAFVRVVGERR